MRNLVLMGALLLCACSVDLRESTKVAEDATDSGSGAADTTTQADTFGEGECGNGLVEGTEVCDDGNRSEFDACSNLCRATYCGDGVVQDTESCDDGNTANGDNCPASCRFPGCGDGLRDHHGR